MTKRCQASVEEFGRSGTRFSAETLVRMDWSAQYQQRAEECERLAKDAKSERDRAILVQRANIWRRLAEAAAAKKA